MAYSYYADPRYRYFNHFYKQAGMPPMDPSMMGGAPPMDPSMMGGGMPPMDPSMMGGGMPPGPPMDPGMVGAPPIDPNAAGLPPAAPPPGDPAAGGGAPAEEGAPAKKNSKQEMDDRPYRLRGDNLTKALASGSPTEYNRLALMCGGTLEIAPREGGGTIVTVRIPAKKR